MWYSECMKRNDVKETSVQIAVPFTDAEWKRLDEAVRAGGFVKGRYVKQAILEKIERDSKR